ncbi:hypothetical protein BKA61DRAFT_709047 [Leptodontidium sp. MPI-SDFR-AT-0119]|nr:hypothetical protein BKA61DRAFT_709047 [Leptodontidium sp. MPI-SDFR-AT-0119]
MTEEYLNSTISHAVIPVPCSFAEKQIQATKDAACRGGLEALYMRSNPISVSIAHHLDLESYFRRLRNDQGIYIVYDTGDKEPELTLVSIDRGVFDVIGTVRDKGFRRNDFKMSRMEQQSILAPSRIIELVEELLSESKVELNGIDDIVLSEDPSRTTEAQGVLESYFGKLALAPI